MKAKIYPVEVLNAATKTLNDAPALAPKYKSHEEVLSELSKQVKELHIKKNYDARQITQLLKDNGIKATLKEVKIMLEK